MGPRGCGVFRVEVREARTMHLIRRTLLGASAVGLATLLASATLMSLAAPAGAASAQPQIPQFAAAQAAAKWLGDPAGRRRQHRRVSLDDGQRHSCSGGRARHRCRAVGPVLHGGQRQRVHQFHVDPKYRRSRSVGLADPGRARHERRSDQLRRDQPPGEDGGHRADVGCRRRAVRDGGAVERLHRRWLRPRVGLHRPQGNRADRPTRRRSTG